MSGQHVDHDRDTDSQHVQSDHEPTHRQFGEATALYGVPVSKVLLGLGLVPLDDNPGPTLD